jgi:Protein of unknown function (DUF2381)
LLTILRSEETIEMTHTRFIAVAVLGLCVLDSSVAATQSLGTEAKRSEAEFLVPPQGGAFDVPVHTGAVCILSFPEKLGSRALASSPDFEIKAWGDDGVAVRAIGSTAKTTTLALAADSGKVKVNVTLTVVAPDRPAYTLVRFKAVSAEEAFEAKLKDEVSRRVAPLEAELAKLRQNLDSHIRDRADGLLADRLLKRNETVVLTAHQRNDDHVIVHVIRGALVGEDGYLVFEIENRSGNAYRLASVRVQEGDRDISGPARLKSPTTTRDPSLIGVVPAGATGRGIVVVRSVDGVLGKELALTVIGPSGSQPIRIDHGIVFR